MFTFNQKGIGFDSYEGGKLRRTPLVLFLKKYLQLFFLPIGGYPTHLIELRD